MSIIQPELIAAVHRLPAITSRTMNLLLTKGLIDQPISRWAASQLTDANIEPARAQQIISELSKLDLAAARTQLEKHRAIIVTILDETYPALLREIPSPPPVLYVRGRIASVSATMLAVVGTRRPTPYGLVATKQLVRPVAQAGIGIVSGLALGIDGLAHQIALDEQVPTVAVLGCGIDQVYPWQHRDLADAIVAAGGAVITEFPLGAEPERYHFPQRNRIISGLSRGVLLVEAGNKSGALITAKFAVDQNREVLAVPGPITSPQSIGPIHWIQLGAKAVLTANDILELFSLPATTAGASSVQSLPTDPLQKNIVEHLSTEPLHVDVISASCRLESSVVSATLVLLELDGRVAHHGGMYYSLTS